MAKKYLSLEEAAAMLGLTQAALKKAREAGDLRGFADRGNWKFREEDIQEYARTRQVDSNPEMSSLPESKAELTLNFGDDDSNVLSEGDNDIGEQPTIIRRSGDSNVLSGDSDLMQFGGGEGASDSGVRLVLDSSVTGGDGTGSNILSDSASHIPISFGDSSKDEGASKEIPISFGDSSQELVLSMDDDDDDTPAVLRGMGDSDSDVRLASDSAGLVDSGSGILLPSSSDSDVRLRGKTMPIKLDPSSDSDVRLIKTGSDSDVKLLPTDSDSDVRLLPNSKAKRSGSDSDVTLRGANKSSGSAVGDEDDEDLSSDGALMLGEGSGIRLDTSSDSGISLDSGSGISLDMDPGSGIALDTGGDSDISLAMDDDDEGITLDPGGDSGIALDLPDDSGLSLDSASMEATIPLMKAKGKPAAPGKRKSDPESETLISIPALGGDDDEGTASDTDFELGTLDGDSSTSDTSVLLFDDDEDEADDRAATMIKKKGHSDETFDLDDAGSEEFEDVEEEELVGEDDELDEAGEDFMADDDDFEEDASAAEGKSGAAAPAVGFRPAVEHEWGPIVFAMTLLSSVAMLVCAGVMFDLVRFLWRSGEYGTVAGPVINALGLK